MGKKRKAVKYVAADGAQFTDAQAQLLGETAEQIAKTQGLTDAKLVTPAMLIKAAKPARSPIHKLFEWSDAKAANAHRLQQARQLLNHLEVEIVVEDTTTRMRAFHHVTVAVDDDEIESGYSHIQTVSLDTELSEQVVEKAKQALRRWKERYASYRAVFEGVMAEIEAL